MAAARLSKITNPNIKDALRLRSVISGKPLIGPKSVNIHINNSCNHRCEFCWNFSPYVRKQPKRKVIDYKVLEDVLEDCREMGVDEINFEGGEVTLYPFWIDLFRKVKDLGMRLIAYSHLDCDTRCLRGLCYADQLTVNLSAITEESFKRVHGKKASLSLVLKNLDRLLAIRDKRGKPEIVLSFVVYSQNYRELAGFLDIAHKRKVNRVVVRFFKATREMRPLVFSKDALASLNKTVEKALQTHHVFKHNLQHLRHILSHGKLFNNVVSMAHSAWHNDRLLFYDVTGGRINCHAGWFDANIDEQGRVVAPCDNVGVCVAGNIYERRFKDIWFDNDLLHKTLKDASRGIHTRSAKWKECRNCGFIAFNKMLEEKISFVKEDQSFFLDSGS